MIVGFKKSVYWSGRLRCYSLYFFGLFCHWHTGYTPELDKSLPAIRIRHLGFSFTGKKTYEIKIGKRYAC